MEEDDEMVNKDARDIIGRIHAFVGQLAETGALDIMAGPGTPGRTDNRFFQRIEEMVLLAKEIEAITGEAPITGKKSEDEAEIPKKQKKLEELLDTRQKIIDEINKGLGETMLLVEESQKQPGEKEVFVKPVFEKITTAVSLRKKLIEIELEIDDIQNEITRLNDKAKVLIARLRHIWDRIFAVGWEKLRDIQETQKNSVGVEFV